MMETIKHQDSGRPVVAARLLTGNLPVNSKVADPAAFIAAHEQFDAAFVAAVVAWQGVHGLTPDGAIGPDTWRAMAKAAPTCSTNRNRISAATLAIQLLLNGNIACDGIYGPRTKAAVVAYQSYSGLSADGIVGPKTWAKLLESGGDVAEAPCDACKIWFQPEDFKQADKRWGANMYSNHGDRGQTMANSGCGPTAMADIIATVKDKSQTPWTLAKLAMALGDRTYSNGTAWEFFIPHIMEHFHFSKAIKTATLDGLLACLDAGGYVVCSMGPGYWTSGGHYICVWKYDSTYIYANDPASSKRTKQAIAQFMRERKQFWCFWPETNNGGEQNANGDADPRDTDRAGDAVEPVTGEIIDISYHKGAIDFDALKPHVSLVIPRASIGSDIDTRFVEYATAMQARSIPFGVFCYSYARDTAKGEDEAIKIVKYASGFKPLFYAIDIEETCITQAGVRAFVKTLRDLGVKRIGAYVAHHLYATYRFDELRDLFDFVWIPRYKKDDDGLPTGTIPKYACDLWQYTSNGRIDGINGRVDKNVITGQGKSLAWFLGGD